MPTKGTSVRSIRLPDEAWERLRAEAERRGASVNGLISDLLGAGLVGEVKPAQPPQPVRKKAATVSAPAVERMTMPRAAPGSRLKGAKK